ncbi:deoxynucleotidyltransferase terminal-interacting protein 1 [Brevipalpus obovatus]|uniref:deoxynucleotidyltransferase terminal-interacting protein 1 n=1 Tax=Brevipalpus obovatus TaxID=246614 RepID=UPI003D9DE799
MVLSDTLGSTMNSKNIILENGSKGGGNIPDANHQRELSQTYNMRTLNLLNFPSTSNRYNYRNVMNRARIGTITSTAKSLNILRQTLQNSINKDIQNVIQKYIDTFFRPSIANLKKNFGNNSVSEQHLQAVCRNILEEAKRMYQGPQQGNLTAANSPLNCELTDNGSDNENNSQQQTSSGKRRGHIDCESDSESNPLNSHLKSLSVKKKKFKSTPLVNKVLSKVGRAPGKLQSKGYASDMVVREGPKWDSNRLSVETKFVLGSKANKALGFGATRGRLYTKHADVFRYIGDQEDKQWLHERGLMPPAGGRAYLIIKEDIEDLLESEEYKNAPGVEVESMGNGFTVPDNMIQKMKRVMDGMRNGSCESSKARSHKNKDLSSSHPSSPSSNNILNDNSLAGDNTIDSNQHSVGTDQAESRALSPADDLDYLNSSEAPSANPSPFSLITTNSPIPAGLDSALENIQPSL